MLFEKMTPDEVIDLLHEIQVGRESLSREACIEAIRFIEASKLIVASRAALVLDCDCGRTSYCMDGLQAYTAGWLVIDNHPKCPLCSTAKLDEAEKSCTTND